MCFNRLEDVEFGLFAEARQDANAAIACSAVELLDSLNIQIVIEMPDPLGAKAGDFQKLGNGGGKLRVQPIQQAAMIGGDDFLYLGGKVVTNARELSQVLALFRQHICFCRKLAN